MEELLQEIIKRELGTDGLEYYLKKFNITQSAIGLIRYIAHERPELSYEKIINERDEYKKLCKEWLDKESE